MNDEKRLILVLGMHRSGTSLLTKGLEVLGVNLGTDLVPPHESNPKGFWEDSEFFSLNEELLEAIDRSWDDCESVESEMLQLLSSETFFERASELVKRKCQQNLTVGIKDPRFCLLLPFWLKVFESTGISTSFIVVVRNPLSVASSLADRDSIPKAKSLWLWALYNLHVISETPEYPRVVVDYDELMDDPSAEMMRIAHFLKLPVDNDAFISFSTEFLDLNLRHNRFSEEDLKADSYCDPIIFEMYQMLRSEAMGISVPDSFHYRKMASLWRSSLWNLKNLRGLTADLFGENRLLKKRLAEEGDKISRLESSLYLCAAKVAFLEYGMKDLKSSRSWKITAPLRFLLNLKDVFAGRSPGK